MRVNRVAVVGAGIVGLCTAWWLRQRGLEVTVFERRDQIAAETSWGNAGVIAPAYVTPWAAPGMPLKVLRSLLSTHSPVRFKPSLQPALWRWLRAWLSECELERYRRNKSRMQRLAFHSRGVLHAMRRELQIEDGRVQGLLQLLRTPRDRRLVEPARALLAENQVPHAWLTPDAVYQREPGLSRTCPLEGALWLPEDESASCPQFAQALARAAIAAGVDIRLQHRVTALRIAGGALQGLSVQTAEGRAENPGFDAVVVAGAVDALPLLATHGIPLPIWPVKGYSTTLALPDPTRGPAHPMMDEAFKVAITPLPGQLRLAGTAEIGDHGLAPNPAALRTLIQVGQDWFGDAVDWREARCWVGARPMTPDGPPLLGATPIAGLFLNMGHGSTGWAMAAGSGQVLADVLTGRPPEIDLEGLTLDRLRGRP